MAVVHTLVRDALLLDETCLSANLGSDFVVRKTGCRENGNLLATGNGVHGVDGRDTGGDHLLGVDLVLRQHSILCMVSWRVLSYSGVGVDGTAVDVEVFFRQHLGALVNGTT